MRSILFNILLLPRRTMLLSDILAMSMFTSLQGATISIIRASQQTPYKFNSLLSILIVIVMRLTAVK